MRLIASTIGTVAIQAQADDVMPARGILQKELINFIASRYNFGGQPEIVTEVPAGVLPPLQFQSGIFTDKNQETPVLQLSIFPDGDCVTAKSTDLAAPILLDLLSSLNSHLGYSYDINQLRYQYSSALVVEFDSRFVDILINESVSQTIKESFPDARQPPSVQRISINLEEGPSHQLPSVRMLVPNEIIIERRAGSLIKDCRFFCVAPLTTSGHLSLLEKMERDAISTTV